MDDMLKNSLGEVLGLALVAALLFLANWLRVWLSKWPPSLKRFTQANQAIHQILAELRIHLDAQRVYLLQFRNGVKFDNNTPVFRLYMTHEVVGRGIGPITGQWSGILASQVTEIVRALFTGPNGFSAKLPCSDCAATKDCAKREFGATLLISVKALEEGYLKSMLIAQGTESLLVAPMLDGGNVVGFVGADFFESKSDVATDACDRIAYAAANSAYELASARNATSLNPIRRVTSLFTKRPRGPDA